jgi:hypothetical protein
MSEKELIIHFNEDGDCLIRQLDLQGYLFSGDFQKISILQKYHKALMGMRKDGIFTPAMFDKIAQRFTDKVAEEVFRNENVG